MPRTPRLLSPTYLVRQNALYQGVFGSSRFWKAVAIVVFGRGVFRRLFGKHPDHLGVETLRAGQSVTITSIPPPPSRRRRRADRRRARSAA